MQGGRFTQDGQLQYRSYRCRTVCDPDSQSKLSIESILKQIKEFKTDIVALSTEMTRLERIVEVKHPGTVARVGVMEARLNAIFT